MVSCSPAAPSSPSQLVSCRYEPLLVHQFRANAPGFAALGQQNQAPMMHVGALVAMRLGIRSLQCHGHVTTSLEAQAPVAPGTKNFKEPEAAEAS